MARKESNNRSKILKVWREYEFKLLVPTIINKDNKIEVHFKFFDQETGKNKQIKKSTGIDRYATPRVYTQQATDLIDTLIYMLEGNYNFISKCYPDYIKLTQESTVLECISTWLKVRIKDKENGVIRQSELDITGYVFDYYKAFLKLNNHLSERASYFTVNDVNTFMRYIEKKRLLSPYTYNSYQSRLTLFYDYLINERVTVFNPSRKAYRYKTKNLKTRFVEFDDNTLANIKTFLKTDEQFKDLYIASKLLYDYSIREVEQLRVKLDWIDFKEGYLVIPEKTIENGVIINSTKNGLSAKFKLEDEHLALIKNYIGERDAGENYLFGGHNRPSLKRMNDKFLSQRWQRFREVYNLPETLKMYALKHTGNYNSLDKMTPDQLGVIARHQDSTQIQAYIKKRKQDPIKLGEKQRF